MPFASNSQNSKMDSNSTSTKVEIQTDLGAMTFKLYNETPQHRDNFIKLINEGFYNGTLFHRVIKNFMIQGGDPDSKNAVSGKALGMGDVGYTVPAEMKPELIHKKGTLCAARTENPAKASSGCQFYISQGKVYSESELNAFGSRMGKTMSADQIKAYTSTGGIPHLDGGYTVFGEMISGFDVLDKIAVVATDPRDRPLQDVKMTIKVIK